jgi:hypothetical protein
MNFTLGVWLVIAPFVLLYRGIQGALWDDVAVGLLIAAYSLWRALEIEQMIVGNWIVGALGLWALVSPFVLHFSGAPVAPSVSSRTSYETRVGSKTIRGTAFFVAFSSRLLFV